MYLCLRTTVDIPDFLLGRVKKRIHTQNMTFRSLVILALERALEEDAEPFRLRDASIGNRGRKTISNDEINQLIDTQRDSNFQR
jgi:hypothetical protein